MKRTQNYSALLDLVNTNDSSKPMRATKAIAAFLFTSAFVVSIIGSFFSEEDDFPFVAVWGGLSMVGIIIVAIMGVRIIGSQNGKNSFLGQLLFVLGRVFIYVFLPAILIALAVIIFAMATGRWNVE